MEKIYIESESKKPKRKSFMNNFFNDRGSVTALVILAVVGVMGLMVFGLNQISFATDETQVLPESFVSKQGKQIIGVAMDGSLISFGSFYTKDNLPVFCIEKNNDFVIDTIYTQNEEITDYGLIYLMSNLYPNKMLKDSAGNELPTNAQTWLTQAAIWSYLYEVGDPNNSEFASDNERVKTAQSIYDDSGDLVSVENGNTLFEHFGINTLIAQAKNVGNVVMRVSKASDNISVTKDNKYYQSDLITIVVDDSLSIIDQYGGYSVTLVNAPHGTILVDEAGNVYDDITHMSATSKFYVRVPVDKVNNTNKNLSISINGKFRMWGANKYISTVDLNHQKVANVKLLNREINVPLDIQLDYTPDVPDTGMGVAQKIYFIGLILLLSGVGIVYANAKTKESE